MSQKDIVRAWKDPQFRRQLGADAPVSPVGAIELSDALLDDVSGGVLRLRSTVTSVCTTSAACPKCCGYTGTSACPMCPVERSGLR